MIKYIQSHLAVHFFLGLAIGSGLVLLYRWLGLFSSDMVFLTPEIIAIGAAVLIIKLAICIYAAVLPTQKHR